MRVISISFTLYIFFFFNDTATTEIYTLSLHDALPISKIKKIIATITAQILMSSSLNNGNIDTIKKNIKDSLKQIHDQTYLIAKLTLSKISNVPVNDNEIKDTVDQLQPKVIN